MAIDDFGGESPRLPSERSECGEVAGRADIKQIALRVVKSDISTAKNASDAEKAKRSRFYSLYRARGDEGRSERDRRSAFTSSDVMNCIEWIMPDMMKAFAGNRKVIAVVPRGAEDVKKAEKIEKLLNWQFMHQCQGFLTLQAWIKAGLVYGISHIKTGWDEQYAREGFAQPEVIEPDFLRMVEDDSIESLSYLDVYDMPVPTQAAGMPNALSFGYSPERIETMRVYTDVRGERKIKSYSGPKLEVIAPEDFLIDPEAKDVDSARYVVHRVVRTVSYLREKERDGVYSNIDQVVKLSAGDDGTDYDETEAISRLHDSASYSAMSGGDMDNEAHQVGRRRVDVFEWWGELDASGDGRTESYLVVMCKDTIIRMEKNPYAHGKSPFVDLLPIPDIFSYEGIGYAELAGSHQEVKTAVIRQLLDNASFTNNQMWEVDENAGVDVEALASPFPGKVIFTNRLGGFKPITPAQLDASSYNLIEFAQGQLEQLTGVTRYNQGLDAKSLNKTATGISAIMDASSKRKELIARTIAETGLRKLFMKMLQLNQQFIDQNIVIRLFNEPLEISPDDLAGNFDVSVDIGSSVTDDDSQVQQLLLMIEKSPFLMQLGIMRPDNVFAACKKVLDIWGYKNTEVYLANPHDTEVARQAMAAIARLAQFVQGTGRIPPVQVVTQVLQAAYGALAKIAGAVPEGGVATDGTGEDGAPTQDRSDAEGRAGQFAPAVIASRYGRAAEAGGVLPAGSAQQTV
ncbi:MAG: hypothetical protein Q4D58_09785 [Synergistaceae bacterium]|nr:hypothetical protein [Synergistaceae bacterium]